MSHALLDLAEIKSSLLTQAMNGFDVVMATWPRPAPKGSSPLNARIIAHRGLVRDGARENTLAAFAAALASGAWGIEFDVRFTACGEPVVHHDANCRRVFGQNLAVEESSFRNLRERFADLPSLFEVIEKFRGRLHFMIELKASASGPPTSAQSLRQVAALNTCLRNLTPGQDFHLMSLQPSVFETLPDFPPTTFLPIAEFNLETLSRLALNRGYAGVSAHYGLLPKRIAHAHHQVGQKIGTGFISSRYALYRELRREVDWIFTNDCDRLVTYLAELQVPLTKSSEGALKTSLKT